MTLLYKLTDQNHKTHTWRGNDLQWGEGVEHQDLGSDGWLTAYTDPLRAILLNFIRADAVNSVLWEAEGEIGKLDGCKAICRALRTVRVVPLPKVTTEQRVKFAILCAKQVCKSRKWNAWADAWLSGKDRSRGAAQAAWLAAEAAKAAVWAPSLLAAKAAEAAASAAVFAAEAEATVWAAEAAEAAGWAQAVKVAEAAAKRAAEAAAEAAGWAERAASTAVWVQAVKVAEAAVGWVADVAKEAGKNTDLAAIAREAVQ